MLISVGDLVTRGDLMFLVVQIGWDYQEGFALCRELGHKPRDYWIMKSLLEPVSTDLLPTYPPT